MFDDQTNDGGRHTRHFPRPLFNRYFHMIEKRTNSFSTFVSSLSNHVTAPTSHQRILHFFPNILLFFPSFSLNFFFFTFYLLFIDWQWRRVCVALVIIQLRFTGLFLHFRIFLIIISVLCRRIITNHIR